MPIKDPEERREYYRKRHARIAAAKAQEAKTIEAIPSLIPTTPRRPKKTVRQPRQTVSIFNKSPDIVQRIPIILWLCSIGGFILGVLALIAVYNTQIRVSQLINLLQSLAGS